MFVSVADVESLPPGASRTVHAKGREFALFNIDGEFLAIDNECTHRGGPLGAGHVSGGKVYCPLHGWSFEIRTGHCSANGGRPVKSYRTRVLAGEVQIEIPPA